MRYPKLHDSVLPKYSIGEERMNTITHAIGIVMGIFVLLFCTLKAAPLLPRTGCMIYGLCMIAVYTVSTAYHALPPGDSKKILRVLDHCTIYLLIAGTYTPILLSCFVAPAPYLGWILLFLQWAVAATAIYLNILDMRRFRVFSYTAYIVMGWAIIFVTPTALSIIGTAGFLWLLAGGISYTVGAVLYAIGSKRPWFHSVFHIFVLLGSLLQFLSIYLYIL